jgi:peptidoglycan/LPS O-acetylase OafA/YrhL
VLREESFVINPHPATSAVVTKPTAQAAVYSRHFYSLDALRGLAALCVVFCHWKYFFFFGKADGPIDLTRMPLYSLFEPFYTNGWRAVDLFFCLSGFIFFWLYSDRVAERRISAWEFIVLRFSRLYPLHFATLIIAAVCQIVLMRVFGSFFVYPNNSLLNFVFQALFLAGWGFTRGLSFNGPSWSISVEVLLYAVFFLLCFFRGNRWWLLIPLALLSNPLDHWQNPGVSRGFASFFVGGMAYYLFLLIWRRGLTRFHVIGFVVSTVLLWIVLPINMNHFTLYGVYHASGWQGHFTIAHKDPIGATILMVTPNACELILFPMTILTLAVCEAFRGTLGKRLAFLGNSSYSIYLLHFPLQLVITLVMLTLSIPNSIFYSPWLVLVFFSVLIPLALGCFHFFELPMQKLLREKLLPGRIKATQP